MLQAELVLGVEILRCLEECPEHAVAGLGEAGWEAPVAEERSVREALEQGLDESDAVGGDTANGEPLELESGVGLGWGLAGSRELRRLGRHPGQHGLRDAGRGCLGGERLVGFRAGAELSGGRVGFSGAPGIFGRGRVGVLVDFLARGRGRGRTRLGQLLLLAAGRGRWLASTIMAAVASVTRRATRALGGLPSVRLGGVAGDEHNGGSWGRGLGAGTSSGTSSGLGGRLDQGAGDLGDWGSHGNSLCRTSAPRYAHRR